MQRGSVEGAENDALRFCPAMGGIFQDSERLNGERGCSPRQVIGRKIKGAHSQTTHHVVDVAQ
jgi:hypothetical protein